ncbi:MAG: membrane bound O-acyl transferase family-domain-containing protein [Armatimonadetes bacterium]|nr:membrane bound O-acyl transferase family-domain-containing protein [Armatimonadota bacterium]
MGLELQWPILATGSLATLLSAWFFAFSIRSRSARSGLAFALPCLVVGAAIASRIALGPSARLALTSLVLLFAFKVAALLLHPRDELRTGPWLGKLAYLLAWPGIDARPFLAARVPFVEDGRRFGFGMVRLFVGVGGFLLLAGLAPNFSFGWLAIAAILLAVHLGFSDALTEVAKAFGWKVRPLFDAPWRSTSLLDFWSRRWNRPFVEMNRIFFTPFLTRTVGVRGAIFGTFLISGILHELAISYPAGAGWGGPLAYFALQGLLVLIERRLPFRGPLWVASIVLGPLPLLFHQAFRAAIIVPFVQWTHDRLIAIGVERAVSILIIGLGVAQLLVLLASFQVPSRLRWREELPRLGPFNQKLMWTYGSFIVFTIVAWGVLTLVLRDDILHGTRAGVAISTVICLFWGFRLVTDAFYFRTEDWPRGPFMQIGHILLNCLFTFVFLGYALTLSLHLLRLI